MINLEKIFEDVSEFDTIEAIQALIKRGVTPEQYKIAYQLTKPKKKIKINGWDKDGDMCHICGQKEDLTRCEGCNKLACEDHYTQALCDSCMAKVEAMSDIEGDVE